MYDFGSFPERDSGGCRQSATNFLSSRGVSTSVQKVDPGNTTVATATGNKLSSPSWLLSSAQLHSVPTDMHSFIHQAYNRHLLYGRHCADLWSYKDLQGRPSPCPKGATLKWGDRHRNRHHKVTSLPSSPLSISPFPPLPPHLPPCCASNTPGTLLPQDLCTY